MEIGHSLPATGLGQAATWAVGMPPGDAAGLVDPAASEPGQGVDNTVESAAAQTLVRAQPPVTEVHNTDEVMPTSMSVDSEFAAPSALLVPVALVGLQVEAAASWPMPWHSGNPLPPRVERDSDHAPPPPPVELCDEEPDEEPADEAPADNVAVSAETVVEDPVETTWCEPLTRALRSALASRVPPQALLSAAEQWKRARCVVLACPQGDDPHGPAWAFVLWPHVQVQGAINGVAPPLVLRGLRVEARLQWSAPPREGQWSHVRVVKEHHPRSGRQLVSLDDTGSSQASRAAVPCEVQLGPVLARAPRWCEVRLRIQAAQRFWNALGTQWSALVVVSAQPLIAAQANAGGRSPC